MRLWKPLVHRHSRQTEASLGSCLQPAEPWSWNVPCRYAHRVRLHASEGTLLSSRYGLLARGIFEAMALLKAAFLVLILAAFSRAQELGQSSAGLCPGNMTGSLSVEGQAQLTRRPDIGLVSLSISTKAPSATKARDQAAEVAAAVISAIDGVPQVSGDDVTTASVQLQPAYTSDREGNRIQEGYSFTQDLQVKVLNLTEDRLAGVIDAAVKAGGDNMTVESVQTQLSPELQLSSTNAARIAAVQNGWDTARLLTKASNVTILYLQSMSDSNSAAAPTSNEVRATGAAYAMAAPAAAPPSPPSSVTVSDTTIEAHVPMSFVICTPKP